MNEKFKPVREDAFPLGLLHGTHFSVALSRKSGFDGFERHTTLPYLHLSVSADDEAMTWQEWKRRGAGIGLVIDVVRMRTSEILRHFFADALTMSDAGVRIELNDENSARRQTVHFHFEVGHKDLFGEKGLVRQCIESLLKPSIIAAEAYTRGRREANMPPGFTEG